MARLQDLKIQTTSVNAFDSNYLGGSARHCIGNGKVESKFIFNSFPNSQTGLHSISMNRNLVDASS